MAVRVSLLKSNKERKRARRSEGDLSRLEWWRRSSAVSLMVPFSAIDVRGSGSSTARHDSRHDNKSRKVAATF